MGDMSISPPPTPSTMVSHVRRFISAATGKVLGVTDWIGQQLHISSKWASRAGFLVLWGIGMTFIQVDEYGLALVAWALSAVVLFSKAIDWKGISGNPRATLSLRILFVLTAISFIPLSVMWTQAKRGSKPWTSLKVKASTNTDTRLKVTEPTSPSKQQTLGLNDPSINGTSVLLTGLDTAHPKSPFRFEWGDGSITVGWLRQTHHYPNVTGSYTVRVTGRVAQPITSFRTHEGAPSKLRLGGPVPSQPDTVGGADHY